MFQLLCNNVSLSESSFEIDKLEDMLKIYKLDGIFDNVSNREFGNKIFSFSFPEIGNLLVSNMTKLF
jgi:hypothetical protein